MDLYIFVYVIIITCVQRGECAAPNGEGPARAGALHDHSDHSFVSSRSRARLLVYSGTRLSKS